MFVLLQCKYIAECAIYLTFTAMNLKHRIEGFVLLGEIMRAVGSSQIDPNNQQQVQLDALVRSERAHNGWFTDENVRRSLLAHGEWLTEERLSEWLGRYDVPEEPSESKTIATVLAGNIPLVGFHDILCVLLSRNKVLIKFSRDDARLIPFLLECLVSYDSGFKELIRMTPGKLTDFDAVIATGSGNTARYFNHYFGKHPHVIRKNRTSVAVLTGEETEEELKLLAEDVFTYFGLGCRNVTKVFMPEDFDLDRMFGGFFHYGEIANHNKYANNYDYHKALWLLNGEDLIENGFLLVKEDEQLVSPVGSLFIQRYKDQQVVETYLNEKKEEIQCVVGRSFVPFGKAQSPDLMDYADDVDTMKFILELQ